MEELQASGVCLVYCWPLLKRPYFDRIAGKAISDNRSSRWRGLGELANPLFFLQARSCTCSFFEKLKERGFTQHFKLFIWFIAFSKSGLLLSTVSWARTPNL